MHHNIITDTEKGAGQFRVTESKAKMGNMNIFHLLSEVSKLEFGVDLRLVLE